MATKGDNMKTIVGDNMNNSDLVWLIEINFNGIAYYTGKHDSHNLDLYTHDVMQAKRFKTNELAAKEKTDYRLIGKINQHEFMHV